MDGPPASTGSDIGVVGSPSSSARLLVDILEPSVEDRLVGAYCVMEYRQGGRGAYALGQITEVTLRNAFAEEPAMKGLIRQRGSVPPVSEQQDSHAAELMVGAVFEEGNGGAVEQATFDTVPHTGTAVRRIGQPMLDWLTREHSERIVRIGRALDGGVLLPSWFRHFGPVKEGGVGDAMHTGIFGKTGSGKSVLGRMILLSYMRNKEMSMLVLDPQGELSKMADDETVAGHVRAMGRTIKTYDLSKIALGEDWDVFKALLVESGFFKALGIRHIRNQQDAADQVQNILWRRGAAGAAGGRQGQDAAGGAGGGLDDFTGGGQDGDTGNDGEPREDDAATTGRIYLRDAHRRGSFDRVWGQMLQEKREKGSRKISRPVLDHIYTDSVAQNRVVSTMKSTGPDEHYRTWARVARMFTSEGRPGAVCLDGLLEGLGQGRVVIVNLAEPQDDARRAAGARKEGAEQTIVINHILGRLVRAAQERFSRGGDLNALVVLDEAHRFAPREGGADVGDDTKALRATLRDAVRTTRKFKLGWMFISQTLASLDKELLMQLRMYFFGYGLGWGSELRALKDLIGGNPAAQRLYQNFNDPRGTGGSGGGSYSFMSIGPSSPLSTTQIPQFFNALDYPGEFVSENGRAGGGQ